VGNSWRTTGDIRDSWDSVIQIVDNNIKRWRYAGERLGSDDDPLRKMESTGLG
jgi:alpha-galactosidase